MSKKLVILLPDDMFEIIKNKVNYCIKVSIPGDNTDQNGGRYPILGT